MPRKKIDKEPIKQIPMVMRHLHKIPGEFTSIDMYHAIIDFGQEIIFTTTKNTSEVKAVLVEKQRIKEYPDYPLVALLESIDLIQHAFDKFKVRQLELMDTKVMA